MNTTSGTICPYCHTNILPEKESLMDFVVHARITLEEVRGQLARTERALRLVCEAWDGLDDPWNDKHRTVDDVVAYYIERARSETT